MSSQVVSKDGGRPVGDGASETTAAASAAPARRGSRAIWTARLVLGAMLLVNVMAGGTIWAHSANAQGRAAREHLRQQLALIQQMLGRIDLTQPQELTPLQYELQQARVDMNSLSNTLPFGGRLAVGAVAAEFRLLSYGIAVDDTAQDLIATWQALEPSLIGLRDSILQEPSGNVQSEEHLLTLDDVHAAQKSLRSAIAAWSTVLAARAALSTLDITSMEAALPAVTPFVQRLDPLSGSITAGLAATSSLLDAAPGYLGLDGQGYVLLVETNTDITRPTGGLIQHEALLNFAQGALHSPIELAPVAALDCPHANCPVTQLPSPADWSPLSDVPVQLHDAGLDPELQVTGYVIQRDYTQTNPVHLFGVIVVTPALFTNILRAVGPLAVPALRTTFTAQNAETLLSFYHRASPIATRASHPIAVDADVLLAHAVLARLATLDPTQRALLGEQLLRAIATKDLQFYSTDSRIEASLTQLGVGGSVAVPTGDSLYIVDTNITSLPAKPFVHESATDAVTLDAQGGATHALSITYTYDAHPQGLPLRGSAATYTDVVRVVVPNLANSENITSGCVPAAAIQAFHGILACELSLAPGGEATVQMTWYAPNVYALPTSVSNAPQNYTLLIQRQPGAIATVSVTITAPQQYPFATVAVPEQLVNGAVQWEAAPLVSDTVLRASFAPATFAP